MYVVVKHFVKMMHQRILDLKLDKLGARLDSKDTVLVFDKLFARLWLQQFKALQSQLIHLLSHLLGL